jgi:arginyl-tRNA synthetase
MEIKAKIENWVKATTLLSQITLTHPKEIKNGDYAFFAGGQAEEFGQNLVKNRISEIEKVEVVGPFVNLYLTKEFFASRVL